VTALLACLLLPSPARAWDPFWSEDPNVERGNERFLARDPRGAIEAYRAGEMSQRPEVLYDIGLAALALAETAQAAPPGQGPAGGPAAQAGAARPQPAGADAGTDATGPEAPQAPAPVDDTSQCLAGVRAACLRLAQSSFARAVAGTAERTLRANAFHNLGNVYLRRAEDLEPPPVQALPDLGGKSCEELKALLESLKQAAAAFDDAFSPLDKAAEQYQAALVERPDDPDSAWNLAFSFRRRREMEDRKAALEEQVRQVQALVAEKCEDQQQQDQQQQDQQQQDQQQQDQQQQDQQQQDQQQQDQQQQDQQNQQQDEERRRQEEERRRRQEAGQEQDIQQQLQNRREQEELFQQLRQREEAEEEQAIPLQPFRRPEPDIDW
jgi:hypothetical protein